jgi:hypothetical protein
MALNLNRSNRFEMENEFRGMENDVSILSLMKHICFIINIHYVSPYCLIVCDQK